MEDEEKIVNLVVVNVSALEAGLSAKASFGVLGGIIGSDVDAFWYLTDQVGTIFSLHCEIVFIDGAFCIKDICGETYINFSHMPLGKEQYARLSDEDCIKIGDYELRVFLNRKEGNENENYSLEQLFSSKASELLDDVYDSENIISNDIGYTYIKEDSLIVDPIEALNSYDDKPLEESLLEDEVRVFSNDFEEELLDHINNNITKYPSISLQADTENDIESAFSMNGFRKNIKKYKNNLKIKSSKENSQVPNEKKRIDKIIVKEAHPMDDNVLDLLEQEMAENYSKHELPAPRSENNKQFENRPITNNHVLGGPMLAGLGVDVGNHSDMEEMQSLSAEMGATLRICIQGLLDLHTQVKDSRYGMMHRSLQPIEDNPLRLGLSYEETIRTMFDEEKSAVHLSAASSVEESLRMIKIHNEAVQYATNTALGQILKALSPDSLLKRFNRYSRKPMLDFDEDKSWAWDMYGKYYQELTSNRQQGFEKLFWEIFEQSYDKKVREKHAE